MHHCIAIEQYKTNNIDHDNDASLAMMMRTIMLLMGTSMEEHPHRMRRRMRSLMIVLMALMMLWQIIALGILHKL